MKRFASNFAILLVLTVAITAVLAMLADAPQRAAEPPADSAAAAESSPVCFLTALSRARAKAIPTAPRRPP